MLHRLTSALALLVPATVHAQTTVETVGSPEDDPRHPTAAATRVALDPASGEDPAAAVDAVPGVHSRRTSFGQTAYATIRGSSSRQVLVEVEGLRLSPPFGPGFDLGTAALGYDAVTVWRGAAATYRGSGALAGALELQTHLARRPGTRLRGRVLRGSHDTLAGSVDAEVATRDVSTRLGVGGRFSEGDFAFTDAQGVPDVRINNDHRRFAAFGASELRDGNAWLRTTIATDLGERGTPGLSEFQDQFARARLDDQHTLATVAVGATDVAALGDFSIDGALRTGAQLRGYEYTNPEPFLGTEPISSTTRSRTAAATLDATAWSASAVARTALDVRYEDWRAEVEADRVTAGIGASWEQRLGQRWLVVGALRGELDDEGREALLPAIGGRFAPGELWRVQANVGGTFRAPNLDELYLELESLRGDPDLQSERAWLADLGARFARDAFAAELIAFARVTRSEIMFLPVTAYLVEAQNIDGTYAAGAEASVAFEPRPFRVRGAYTFTRARFVETGVPVPLQPEHAADARFGLEPLRTLVIWTGAMLRGPQTLDVFGNTRDAAHLFWDAGISLGESPARMTLTARNLLDDDTAVDAMQQPMPGRTLWAAVEVSWRDE